ncbi:MAG: hypothetical protein K2Z80_02530 [Xanthobacteraceae bacterium]|nr:hypothetical protein [Xanthobacteraceae bacterium]
MTGKHLAILATAALVWGVAPAHATDGLKLPGNVSNAPTGTGASTSQAKPKHLMPGTSLCAAKKKKGKGGTKGGGEQYMTIRMQDAMVTSYRPARGGRPKGPPGAGLLGTTGGSFAPNAPSPTGTPVAPPAGGGAAGPVIR